MCSSSSGSRSCVSLRDKVSTDGLRPAATFLALGVLPLENASGAFQAGSARRRRQQQRTRACMRGLVRERRARFVSRTPSSAHSEHTPSIEGQKHPMMTTEYSRSKNLAAGCGRRKWKHVCVRVRARACEHVSFGRWKTAVRANGAHWKPAVERHNVAATRFIL